MSRTRLLPDGRAAERFAALVDGVSPAGGTTAGSTTVAPDLQPLLALTRRMTSMPGPALDPDAAARIRRRLVAVAAVQPAGAAGPETTGSALRRPGVAAGAAGGTVARPRRRRRLAVSAVGGLAAVTTISGVAVAGAHSLPGQPFYGIKRAAESVQLDLASGAAAKGQRELEFAATRLSELRALGIGNSHAASVLADMRTETAGGEADLTAAARQQHDTAPLLEFDRFAGAQAAGINRLAAGAPAAVRADLQLTVGQLRHLTGAIGSVGAGLPGPKLPTDPLAPSLLPSAPGLVPGGSGRHSGGSGPGGASGPGGSGHGSGRRHHRHGGPAGGHGTHQPPAAGTSPGGGHRPPVHPSAPALPSAPTAPPTHHHGGGGGSILPSLSAHPSLPSIRVSVPGRPAKPKRSHKLLPPVPLPSLSSLLRSVRG
jgi:hypothetical protein